MKLLIETETTCATLEWAGDCIISVCIKKLNNAFLLCNSYTLSLLKLRCDRDNIAKNYIAKTSLFL